MAQAMCSIEGCGKTGRLVRGWCMTHYRRWWKHGDPNIKLYGQPKPMCSIGGCDGIACARGWCSKHYERWKRTGDPLCVTRQPPGQYANTICRADDCDGEVKAIGLCGMHYARWKRHGSLERPSRKRPRKRCTVPNCRNPIECREMCDMHYQRWRKHGDPNIRAILLPVPPCSVSDCGNRSAKAGVCLKHYRHFRAKYMAEQDGKCAICKIPESEAKGKKLHLDHNHAINQPPRALLCHHCNVGIGLFRENPAVLRAAARYLEEMTLGQLSLFAA